MSEGIIPLILDGLILVLLAATVFFAARLSLHIRDFRDSRKDLEGLIKDLAEHIIRAEKAIEGLRESAREAGRDLQAQINEGKAIADELQIMSESGNSLASRLERVADKAGKKAGAGSKTQPYEDDPYEDDSAGVVAPETPAVRRKPENIPGFAIRDPEFDADTVMDEDGVFPGETEDEPDEFQSRAERELFEALKGRKVKAGGV